MQLAMSNEKLGIIASATCALKAFGLEASQC